MIRKLLDERGADPENYHLLDYTVDLPLATAAADLVVGRSGASVLEVAALGKPALLVPYPYATGDHQLKNAEWMAAAGAAEIILDSDLNAAVLEGKGRDAARRSAAAGGHGGGERRVWASATAHSALRKRFSGLRGNSM